MNIKEKFPLSWKEFNTYYTKKWSGNSLSLTGDFLQLPFAYAVGIWIDFFNDNGIDLDVQSLNLELIEESVYDSLQILEHSIGHFS